MVGRKLFAVSMYPEQTIKLRVQPSWQRLLAFVLANLDLLLKPDRALGTWLDTLEGVHVLDVVVCLADREAALELGLRFHQWSIFDLANSREIRLRKHLASRGLIRRTGCASKPFEEGIILVLCAGRTISHLLFFSTPYRLRSRFDGPESKNHFQGRARFHTREMVGPLSYVGGKNRLAKTIIEVLPKHTTYVEAFAGGAQVLFHKEPSAVEVLNDLDGEIVNFFRVCQLHHEELIRYFRFALVSRRSFDLQKATDPATLTDIQRAARYLYILKNSFASLVRHPNYHWHVVQPPGFNLEKLPLLLENAHKRLARVQIECLSYDQILQRFDRPATLFYLDPPYYARKLYRYNFTTADFEQLAERLRVLQGKFVLSLNDTPEVRALFHGFTIRDIELSYSAQKHAGRKYGEVLITNF